MTTPEPNYQTLPTSAVTNSHIQTFRDFVLRPVYTSTQQKITTKRNLDQDKSVTKDTLERKDEVPDTPGTRQRQALAEAISTVMSKNQSKTTKRGTNYYASHKITSPSRKPFRSQCSFVIFFHSCATDTLACGSYEAGHNERNLSVLDGHRPEHSIQRTLQPSAKAGIRQRNRVPLQLPYICPESEKLAVRVHGRSGPSGSSTTESAVRPQYRKPFSCAFTLYGSIFPGSCILWMKTQQSIGNPLSFPVSYSLSKWQPSRWWKPRI